MNKWCVISLLCIPLHLPGQPTLISGTGELVDFQITPGQSHLIIAQADSLFLYDISKGTLLANNFQVESELHKSLISPDSSKFYFSSKTELKVFDINADQIKSLLETNSPISNMIVSPLGHLIIGCQDGVVFCLDTKQNFKEIFKLNLEAIISAIEFDHESLEYIISTLDGSIYCTKRDGELSKIFSSRDAIFDLCIQTHGRTFAAVTSNGILLFSRKGESFRLYEAQEKHRWVTSVSSKENAAVFGYGSGLVEVRSSFASYITKFNSSIVRVDMLDQSAVVVIAQTLKNELYLIKGVDMKNGPY